jgi:ATP-binding cassette subfamily B multidrug efflux pump
MFSVLTKLSWFFKENWRRYAIAISLLIIVGVLDVIPPKLIGLAIDDIHTGIMSEHKIFRYLGFLLIIMVLSYGITYIWQYGLFGGTFLVERKLRSRFISHL